MTPRLKSITIEDFRSIRGQISVSLDAPVILIHGQNGAGKTSLLTALELALTGAVPSLAKVEPDYMNHLPHKGASEGGRISMEASGLDGPGRCDIRVTRNTIEKGHLLSDSSARFFSERCYLAQSTLGRLLEIYQHQDTRRTDSPLTLFVKDLLGLDQLDALIAGLHSAGDIRRLRDPAPAYWSARQELPEIEARLSKLRDDLAVVDNQLSVVEIRLRERLIGLLQVSSPNIQDLPNVRALLAGNAEEKELVSIARTRRDLMAIAEQWQTILTESQTHDRLLIEKESTEVTELFTQWQADVGQSLESSIGELKTLLSSRKVTLETGPEDERLGALKSAEAGLARINEALSREALDDKKSLELIQGINQGTARIKILDGQLLDAAGESEGLAQALSSLLPHIHGEDCPVCGRDFGEQFEGSLNAHVSQRIAALVQTSGRLQALARDRATTGAVVAQAERDLAIIAAGRLAQKELDALKLKRARLEEITVRLSAMREACIRGAVLTRQKTAADNRLAKMRALDSSATSLRSSVQEIALAYKQPQIGLSEALDVAANRLRLHIENSERVLTERQNLRRLALLDVDEIQSARRQQVQNTQAILSAQQELRQLNDAKSEADRRIEVARDLARHARETRTAIVRRVFNDDLNSVWRDLFVRLAPHEPFVTAFALPDSPTGPVEAVLETHYRSGGKGGNPLAMLSAGNLNTAALTLFLALHLSVKPILPWLIIDDPVQSMDEVHISQFAAVLRTLSKQKNRQIVIAVHERPLFEYLSLELSPAFPDDRLITVNLARSADGTSSAPWDTKTFKPDRAIAA